MTNSAINNSKDSNERQRQGKAGGGVGGGTSTSSSNPYREKNTTNSHAITSQAVGQGHIMSHYAKNESRGTR